MKYKLILLYQDLQALNAFIKAFQKTDFPNIGFKRLLIKTCNTAKFNKLNITSENVMCLDSLDLDYYIKIINIYKNEVFKNDVKTVHSINYRTLTINSKVVQYFNPQDMYEYLHGESDLCMVKEKLKAYINSKLDTEYNRLTEYKNNIVRSENTIKTLEEAALCLI